MSFPFPINFTRNRGVTKGHDSWRGDNKFDNTQYTLATNVYPKLNGSDNSTTGTFGKARPIKHIRKGRYENGRKTYNNSRLIYELDRPGGATVKVDLSKGDVGCNGVTSNLFLMTKTSAACCPQANSLGVTRRAAGNHTTAIQFKSHQSYSNYFQGRNWSFEPRHQISGKNTIGSNTYLKDTTIKKNGCGNVVYKLSNEKFGIDGAATSANYTQSLRNKPFIHPNINEYVNHIKCEVIMKCHKNGRCLSKPIDTCNKKVIKIFTIYPYPHTEAEPQPEGHFNTERDEADDDGAPLLYQPEPEPEPESPPQPEPEPEPESFPPMTGSIVKGYISGSTINYYKASDPSFNRILLATTSTDEYGKFTIPTESLPFNTYLIQISSGGTDIATGLPLGERAFKHVFKIPSDPVEAAVANNTVTALTSIVAEKVEKTIGETAEGVEITDTLVENNLSEENASLKSNLGLSADTDLGTNYLDQGTGSSTSAMAAVNTMVNSLLNIVSGVQSFADTMLNLTNVLTQKRDTSQTDSLLDTSNLDSIVKSTLNADIAADTGLADTLVAYTTKVKEVVDEVAASEGDGGNESLLENLEKMVKYTSTNTVTDVSNNLDTLDASRLAAEVTVFQIFAPQPEPEREPDTGGLCKGFKENLLKFDKLESSALSQLTQYISFFRDGQFTSLSSSQNNLTQISNLINSSGYFTFSEEEITNYEEDDTLFAEYKIFAHSMIDGLNAAVLLHTQNSILSATNTQLQNFKNILLDKDLLQEFIEVNYNNFNAGLISVEHTMEQGLQLEQHYQLYINRHGIPPNGIFDSNLLSQIYNEINAQPEPEPEPQPEPND